jgi:protein-S-isoprenylcysteine O-methyltransferase Ste14
MTRAALETVATGLIMAAALFLAAGTLRWPMAWALLAVYAVYCVVSFLTLDPKLIEYRSRLPPALERSDLLLSGAAVLLFGPVAFVLCGLDHRLSWSPALPAVAKALGLALLLAGYGFALLAARANPFFSPAIEVQRERGHRVIDAGPYAVVRHPGYAGALVAHVAIPLALGSLVALPAVALGAALLAHRAVREERFLARELDGYAAYMERVRFRLLPGVF